MHTLREEAVTAIKNSYKILSAQKDLSPANDCVTTTLTALVKTLQKVKSPELTRFLLETGDLSDEREGLPVLCGKAECEMEKFWARKLIASKACELAAFWYFPEYTALCEAEIGLFRTRDFKRISFLGSGSLPLTGFMLAQAIPTAQIVCIDMDAEALDLAAQLARKIGLQHRVDMRLQDARAYEPEDGELVICASLLTGREKIYDRLLQHDCALIVRDSESHYQYLYKAAELPPSNRFRQVAKTGIDDKRINTSRYYELLAA